jgi:hypothetical protein
LTPGDDETLTVEPLLAAAAPPVAPPAEGDLLADRYRIRGEIGRGGGGTVYKAFDERARTWVALKLLDPRRWPAARSAPALFRELRIGRSIQHPNVCRVYDVFEMPLGCGLVMEHASGGTLRTTLQQQGRDRPLDDKIADARAVIAGLAAIHLAGLVHRDLKPENLLRRSDGRLAVSDFGLTRPLDQSTVTSRLAGTPGYLAPETLLHARTSQASDVWSLGIVLHEIFTGDRPTFSPKSGRLRRSRPGRDRKERALARLCALCLRSDPRRRPTSAVLVDRWLQAELAGPPPGRRRAHLAAALVALLAALALAPALFRRATRACAPGAQRCVSGGLATCRSDGAGFERPSPCGISCSVDGCLPDIRGYWEDYTADGKRPLGNTIVIELSRDGHPRVYYLGGPQKKLYRPATFLDRRRIKLDYFPEVGTVLGPPSQPPDRIDWGPAMGVWRRAPGTHPDDYEGPLHDPNYRDRPIQDLPAQRPSLPGPHQG